MTNIEAVAVKTYHEMMQDANIEGIDLMYSSQDEIKYYKNTKLNTKEYEYIVKNLNEKSYYLIDVIADYLTQIDEIHKGIRQCN